MSSQPSIAHARAALERLAAAPAASEASRAALAELDAACAPPLTLALRGGDRAAIVNAVVGFELLTGPTAATVRIRRDARAVVDELPIPADVTPEVARARADADRARDELVERDRAIVAARAAVPPVVRKQPAWWAIWLWLVYLVMRWLARHELRAASAAEHAGTAARQRVVEVERSATTVEDQARTQRAQQIAAIRERAAAARDLAIRIDRGALPDGVELVVGDVSDRVDAVIAGERIADLVPLLPALPELLAAIRAIAIGQRVLGKLDSTLVTLDDALAQAETSFAARLARLEAMRVLDADAFTRAQIDGVRDDIARSVAAMIEHAAAHLGAELSALGTSCIGAIASASTGDALKAAAADIESKWDAEHGRIGREVRILILGALGGTARDLHTVVVAPLVGRGLPDEHARLGAAPQLPQLALLPSLSSPGARPERGRWITGLFRSFEARRTQYREQVHDKLEQVRDAAEAELRRAAVLATETLERVLAEHLAAGLAVHATTIDSAITAERAAIEGERARLAPLAQLRTTVREDRARLRELLDRAEHGQPALLR